MDYSYIKREVENERKLNYKEFVDAYEREEKELVQLLSNNIVEQVEKSIKDYYTSSVLKDSLLGRGIIKPPTVFRRYYIYEDNSKDVIFKCNDDAKVSFDDLYGTINYWDSVIPCVRIPENKFSRFWNLLNQAVSYKSMRVELKKDKYGGWYNINIIADIGKL